jgi:hypothetical protein
MNRRKLITLIGSLAIAFSLASYAQQPKLSPIDPMAALLRK